MLITIPILDHCVSRSRFQRCWEKNSKIDQKGAEELSISTGDAIDISSEQRKKTTVLNWPAYQQDYGKGLIRIDGYTRNRLDLGNK